MNLFQPTPKMHFSKFFQIYFHNSNKYVKNTTALFQSLYSLLKIFTFQSDEKH